MAFDAYHVKCLMTIVEYSKKKVNRKKIYRLNGKKKISSAYNLSKKATNSIE
jgi:hypothetical protein